MILASVCALTLSLLITFAAGELPELQRFHAASGRTLRAVFVTDTHNVEFKSHCAERCSRSEVFEVVVEAMNTFQCRCSRIRTVYLEAFPNRYLTVSGTGNARTIFHLPTNAIRSEHVTGCTSVAPFTGERPIVFYALDRVSGGQNLGTLDAGRSSLDMGQGNPHYDCPWVPMAGSPSAREESRQQLLRLVPGERPRYQLTHSNIFNNMNGFTALVWFKVRAGVTAAMPMISNMNTNTNTNPWYMWNYNDATMLHAWFGPPVSAGMVSAANLFRQASWNHFAFRVSGTTPDFFLNGLAMRGAETPRTAALPVTLSQVDMGNKLDIGHAGETTYDGCLAHVMVFNRSLSDVELNQYLALIHDDLF